MSFALGGLASGLDTGMLVEQLMQIERQPMIRLESQKRNLSNEQSFFRSLNTKLRTLHEAAGDLTLSSTFRPTTAGSSDETVLGVTSSENAAQGTYNIAVTQLAQSHVVQSGELDPTAQFTGSGSITIRIQDEELDIDLSGMETEGTPTNQDVLNYIKDEVNKGGLPLTASVIQTSENHVRLVLSADNTGEEIKMTEANEGLLSVLGINADENGEVAAANVARAYQNAIFSVNGVEVTRPSNTIDDVIEGVTFQLQKEGSANITAGTDMEEVTTSIEKFVTAYNDVVSTIRAQIAEEAAFQGDSMLRSLDSQLYNWVQSVVGNVEDGLLLSQFGITIDEGITSADLMTGTMTFNKEVFESKFNENPEAVMDVFLKNDEENGVYGIARLLNDNLRDWTSSAGGIITSRIQGYDSQISFMDDRLEQMELRLLKKEEQLHRQFVRMEIALAQQQNQMQWLSGQLAQLSANNMQQQG